MQYVQCRFHDSHFGINYYDSDVPAEEMIRRRQIIAFHFPIKTGLHDSKDFGSHNLIMCRKAPRPPWGVLPIPDLMNLIPTGRF
jgi:hypothetical protein